MSWWVVLPGIVMMAALWILPGYAVLRLLGIRGLVAWGGGAGVTSGLAGVLGIVYARVGIGWSLGSFLVGALVAVAVAALVGRLLGTTTSRGSLLPAGTTELTRIERRWLAASGGVATLLLGGAMMRGMYHADQPLQAWDAVFHYNALWFVRETGNASSLGGLAPMYADTAAPYYPTVWHSLVAIAPGFERVTEAGNASSIVLGTFVWLSSLVALSRVVWPARSLPVVFTPLIAATFVTFPMVAVSMLGVWPFTVSVACLPGVLALLIAAVHSGQTWQLHTAQGVGFLAAVSGVVLAHPSGGFSFVLLAAPLLLFWLVRMGRRMWRRGLRLLVVGLAVALVVVVTMVTVLVVNWPPVEAVLAYQRGGQTSYLPGILSMAIDQPLIYVYDYKSFGLVSTILVGIGVWLTISRKHARWLVLSLAGAALLTLLAAGNPANPLRVLAGFWYTQPSRLNQLYVIPAVVLAAGGAAWVARSLANRRSLSITRAAVVTMVGVGLLTFGFRWPSQVEVMSSVYHHWPIAWGTILEPEEIAMIDRARETLPPDAVVLGEPVAGSPFLLARADVQVVYPQLTLFSGSPERSLLAEDFDLWWQRTDVCDAVRALGVTHVYTDALTFDDGGKYEETTPGLRNLTGDRPGFELVDSGGKAAIYRFTGCA